MIQLNSELQKLIYEEGQLKAKRTKLLKQHSNDVDDCKVHEWHLGGRLLSNGHLAECVHCGYSVIIKAHEQPYKDGL